MVRSTQISRSPTGTEALRALADPTRQRILQVLLSEEVSVSELVEVMRLPQSTVSRHLKMLREAELAIDRRNGRTALYRAAEQPAGADGLKGVVLAWLRDRPLSKVLQDRLQRVLRKRRDKTVDFFERLGNRWDELRRAAFGDAFATEAFLSLLPQEWTVADVGAGTGFLLPVLAEHFAQVIAIEPAAAMLECARQRIAERGLKNVAFHLSAVEELPLPDKACDLAIACLVMHHVAAPEAALKEMHRILKPGGRLLIVEQDKHEHREFYEVMQDRWWGFDPTSLAEKVAGAGFEIIRRQRLAAAKPGAGTLEVPDLFVLVGRRPGG